MNETTYYVAVAPGSVVVICNTTPLQHGTPGGYKTYIVKAADKSSAKIIAKERFARCEPSEDVWHVAPTVRQPETERGGS